MHARTLLTYITSIVSHACRCGRVPCALYNSVPSCSLTITVRPQISRPHECSSLSLSHTHKHTSWEFLPVRREFGQIYEFLLLRKIPADQQLTRRQSVRLLTSRISLSTSSPGASNRFLAGIRNDQVDLFPSAGGPPQIVTTVPLLLSFFLSAGCYLDMWFNSNWFPGSLRPFDPLTKHSWPPVQNGNKIRPVFLEPSDSSQLSVRPSVGSFTVSAEHTHGVALCPGELSPILYNERSAVRPSVCPAPPSDGRSFCQPDLQTPFPFSSFPSSLSFFSPTLPLPNRPSSVGVRAFSNLAGELASLPPLPLSSPPF